MRALVPVLLSVACLPGPLSLEPSETPVECAPSAVEQRQELVQSDFVAELTAQPWTARAHPSGPGLAVVDYDGDGYLDVAVAAAVGSTYLLHNDGRGGLSPDGSRSALPAAQAIAAGDVDGDGVVDLYLGTAEGSLDQIALGNGTGEFAAVPLADSLGLGVGGAFADMDGDGDYDLIAAYNLVNQPFDDISSGALVAPGAGLYRNDGGGLVRSDGLLPDGGGAALGYAVNWVDANADGWLDIYVANDFGMFLEPNRLYLNDGRGGFEDGASCGCERQGFHMGAAVDDFNGDGLADVHLTDIGGPDLLLGDGVGGFYDTTLAQGASIPPDDGRLASWGTRPIDIDMDGDLDLSVVFGRVLFWDDDPNIGFDVEGERFGDADEQPDLIQRRVGDHFEPWPEVGFSQVDYGRSVVVADLDRDGRPDLITSSWSAEFEPVVRVLGSTGGCGEGITLRAADGQLPVGARVSWSSVDGPRVQMFHPATTFSSSAPEVYLGLGGASQTDIEVRYADGEVERWQGVPVGETVVFGAQ